MEIPILGDLLVVAALAVALLTISYHLRIPGIVGLLLAGIVIGPYGIGLLSATHEVEMMAEIGVVLLLFTIGIEFSLTKLFRLRRLVIIGGPLQVGACILATWGLGSAVGLGSRTSLFLGFLVAMSSTAIVLQTLQERAEIESPYGRASLALLIFQDIAIVPLMLFTPLLAGDSEALGSSLGSLAAKLVGVGALVFVGSRYIVPWILEQVARARRRELFVLCAVAICLAVAWLTSSIGLSLGLGAFLAGLIISESEYSHQTLGGILPFRDVFTSLFFVSIGMLLDIGFVVENPLMVVAALVAVVVLKVLVVGAVMLVVGNARRPAVLTAIALSQIGEFSFLLARAGVAEGLLDNALYQTMLAASVLSMAAAPFLIRIAPTLAAWATRGMQVYLKDDDGDDHERLHDHIVIIGFGFGGQSVARAARSASLVYIGVEGNAGTVRTERAAGEPVVFGDATYESVLAHVQVARASIVAIVINDPIATRMIVRNVRDANPHAQIVVRTRFVTETENLLRLGATTVIPEELEASVHLCAEVLSAGGVADTDIAAIVGSLRGDHYATLRQIGALTEAGTESFVEPEEASIFTVALGASSPLVDRSLEDLGLRARFGLTLLQIRRDGSSIVNPSGSVRLRSGDTLLLFGPRDKRDALMRMTATEAPESKPATEP